MKRLAVVLLATLAALVAAAPSAQAAPPTHERVPIDETPFTDLGTGVSIMVNAAGSAHITDNPDGSLTAVGTGNWGFPDDPETGEPGFVLLSGRWVFTEAQGPTSFSFVGRKVDLCAELAA